MTKVHKITIDSRDKRKYENGYPLITKELVEEGNYSEGDLLTLWTSQTKCLGTAYYGKQNKGFGWIVSNQQLSKLNEVFFVRSFEKAKARRGTLLQNKDTNAFRIFSGEGDGIGGLLIEAFSDFLVIHWYSEGIYTFKEEILGALQTVFPEYKGIYEKKRFAQAGSYVADDDFVSGERAPEPLMITENEMNYAVYLNDGAMVGIFLDQRDVRHAVRTKYVNPGDTVLNTFSYTGAFSVAAALSGGVTTSVDVANRSLEKTEEQFRVNEIDPEEHRILVMDVFSYFKYALRHELQFDLTILDPPSFARTKKTVFRSQKDYPLLLNEAIQITKTGGKIIASTNNASISFKDLREWLQEEAEKLNCKCKVIEEFSLPEDFKINRSYKESNYLKVLVIEKK